MYGFLLVLPLGVARGGALGVAVATADLRLGVAVAEADTTVAVAFPASISSTAWSTLGAEACAVGVALADGDEQAPPANIAMSNNTCSTAFAPRLRK